MSENSDELVFHIDIVIPLEVPCLEDKEEDSLVLLRIEFEVDIWSFHRRIHPGIAAFLDREMPHAIFVIVDVDELSVDS